MAQKKDNRLDELRKELASLLDQINEEGLLFLKQQASTIIYNETVEEMNRSNRESLLDNEAAKRKSDSDRQDRPPRKQDFSLDMSGESKGYANIVYGRIRVFFPLDELEAMAYIARKASQAGDSGLLLYRWLKRERGDFLVDHGIRDYPSPLIDKLAVFLAKV
jgi:hypothetical protein